ncbi:superoxide dismutase [Streptomyces sp. bgisy154]|uniref:superoxide dismutase n=1 Tax=Streptomyces sp. bgisy154 TaxID=3413794 RepID=UPI003D7109AF
MARSLTRRHLLGTAAALGGAAALAGPPASAAQAATGGGGSAASWPATIATPPGFQPEGITIGPGAVAYTGSLLDGSVCAADLATGRGRIITEGQGPMSVGLKVAPYGRLVIAGGDTGQIRVVDRRSGRPLAAWQAATGTAFVNDVVVGCGGAWFTDSFNDVLYHVPVRRTVPSASPVRTLPLTGAWAPTPPGGQTFGANGIELTPDRRGLLVVNDNSALLYRVDPRTGETTEVALTGGAVSNGDGLVLHGRTLYVVRNWAYAVDVFRLTGDGTRGTFVRRITDPRFDEPTTAAVHGDRLYVVNARFDSDWSDPTTSSTIVAVPL